MLSKTVKKTVTITLAVFTDQVALITRKCIATIDEKRPKMKERLCIELMCTKKLTPKKLL